MDWAIAIIGLLILVIFELFNENNKYFRKHLFMKNTVARWAVYVILVVVVLVFGKFGGSDFIYANF